MDPSRDAIFTDPMYNVGANLCKDKAITGLVVGFPPPPLPPVGPVVSNLGKDQMFAGSSLRCVNLPHPPLPKLWPFQEGAIHKVELSGSIT